MKTLHFALYIAGTVAMSAIPAGCGGPPLQDASPAPMLRAGFSLPRAFGVPGLSSGSFATRPNHDRSWMSPSATKARSLLYISSGNDVYVYTYSNGILKGKLTGFSGAGGLCVDANGDVYITEGTGSLEEFARGGVIPIRTLTTHGFPASCSVAPNGDVAVANYSVPGNRYGPGNVQIFRGGKGPAKTYTGIGGCYTPMFVGYDNNNFLFVEGENESYYESGFCYLPSSGSLGVASFSGNIGSDGPAGVMWDGKHITLSFGASLFGPSSGDTVIYRVKVSGSGSVLTPISSTTLSDSCNAFTGGPYLVGKVNTPVNTHEATTVIGDAGGICGGFDFWTYPSGGNPFTSLSGAPGGYSSVSFAPEAGRKRAPRFEEYR